MVCERRDINVHVALIVRYSNIWHYGKVWCEGWSGNMWGNVSNKSKIKGVIAEGVDAVIKSIM